MSNAQNRSLNYGLSKPQDPATLPKSLAPVPKATLKSKVKPVTLLSRSGSNEYLIRGGWEMIAEEKLNADGKKISSPSFRSNSWYNATVPGTVLTTLVDQGVYPDPYWGINNLSIPDTLCRQKWWYRTSFNIDPLNKDNECWLNFKGINYEAVIWLNGHEIGLIKGAFQRGTFNVTSLVNKNTPNILAVHIIPPPHPGIPHEQSILAQRGPNGGTLCLDGPTFISSEGWDWIPGIRDRNMGIWQDVTLRFSNALTIVDPQVITDLDLPDTSKANITIKTGVYNSGTEKKQVILSAVIEGINISQQVTVLPGQTQLVTFDSKNYPVLTIVHPRLWWPNGYGNPELYHLNLSVGTKGNISDQRKVRFGIRELSYELSVDAPGKKNWRVEYNPTEVSKKTDKPIFNNLTHTRVEGETDISSLYEGADASLLTELDDKSTAPYLVFKVNGKRIFCKGGNWGMDDGMKKVSREKLEPYFKLTRQANFNMIRNWTGESTEEVFYDLCDEYGLLVWNDFWISTEGYNLAPLDNKLFLANAKEVLLRFRNHPSIALWCPRNEGFAPNDLEYALASLVSSVDGTRHYQGNSRYLNLRTSGPWYYQKKPEVYFTRLAEGFSTELGTPSVPTAATMRKMMAKEDLWPISDVWHYHDFHFGQKDYVDAIDSLYGAPNGLEDFCKKAQMVNFDSHRSMFESWNSKMWNKASGMLIWMSHPAWPSVVWQAYSSDYETFGSYYGSKGACEPVHIQMNLPDNKVVVANTTLNTLNSFTASLYLYDVKGKKLYQKVATKDIDQNHLTDCFTPQLPGDLPSVYLARLQLTSPSGKIVSHNDYWKNSKGDFKEFNHLPQAKLTGSVTASKPGQINFKVTNSGDMVCVGIKLNLQNQAGKLVLPAYCSEGYFNLLPGESKALSFSYDGKSLPKAIIGDAYNLTSETIINLSSMQNKK